MVTGAWDRRAHALARVARGDVRDLVSEHAGELVLGVQETEQPARDVHVAARQRERVGLGLVGHRELPGALGPLGHGRELLADGAHVALERGVAHESDLLLDPLRTSSWLPARRPA
jgi:hypothetical protein